METATIRIPEEKKNLLKAAASLENRKMNDVVIELIDEYIERRKETMELLAIPGLLRQVQGRLARISGGQRRLFRRCPQRSGASSSQKPLESPSKEWKRPFT